MRLAALDIGSNSVKLLVADVDAQRRPRRLFDEAPITRLSEGLQTTGCLSEAAMTRTIDEVEALFRRAGVRPTELPLSAIVTAPGRRSSNGPTFVSRLAERTGIDAEIVTAEREADLSRLATRRAFPALDPLVMIDLGGASTELVRCRGASTEAAVSVDLGAVRLTEARLTGDPPSADEIEDARRYARVRFAAETPGITAGGATAVLVSGTATTLASMHLKLATYDPEVVHGSRLTREDLAKLDAKLAPLTVVEKKRLPGLNPARADVIFAGLLIVEVLCELLGLDEVTISDQGARWGQLWALIG